MNSALPKLPSLVLALLFLATVARSAEVGTNDFRVTQVGTDGSASPGAFRPAAAYNPDDDEFLVVYESDESVAEGREIYGQRVDGSTGADVGAPFQISQMGGAGVASGEAREPAVAWNQTRGEYLVVWRGDEASGSSADDEYEIYARIASADGSTLGTTVRASDMGPDMDLDFAALRPDVAWDSVNDRYLVVWHGDDDTAPSADGDIEIFGRLLDGAALGTITGDFRISDMNGDVTGPFNAGRPAVAFSASAGEFLVVWEGDEPATAQEIWGQRIDAATGAEIGTNDFRISAMGAPASDADARFNAFAPDVAWNADRDMYLVVWRGDTDAGGLIDNETEIYGQRLTVAGAEIGTDDFRISSMGPDGSALFQALDPVLAYNSVALEYLVAWAGSDDAGTLAAGELEIYGQRLRGGSAVEIGADDERLSDMGAADGSTAQRADRPAVAAGGAVIQTLAAWQGDDATGALADDEFEIYGQFAFLAVPVGLSEFSVE